MLEIKPPPDTRRPPRRRLRASEHPPLTGPSRTSQKQPQASLSVHQSTTQGPFDNGAVFAPPGNYGSGQPRAQDDPGSNASNRNILPNYNAGMPNNQHGHELPDAQEISENASKLFGENHQAQETSAEQQAPEMEVNVAAPAQEGNSGLDEFVGSGTDIDDRRDESSNQEIPDTTNINAQPEDFMNKDHSLGWQNGSAPTDSSSGLSTASEQSQAEPSNFVLEAQDETTPTAPSTGLNAGTDRAQAGPSLASMLQMTIDQGRTTIDPNLLSNTGKVKRKLDATVPPSNTSAPTGGDKKRRTDSAAGCVAGWDEYMALAIFGGPPEPVKLRCRECAIKNIECEYQPFAENPWPCNTCKRAKIICTPP
ncbi:hypothetical protein AC579_6567 [Pseudocercospora musae]|uniref:Zn(2)-C6 fungal-type domain-containing protein n=1 Tax=Pseudocercospora musae TaxID=113226 RepID=A0A139I1S7_9PEZI|nr:hypothetical protein AC579_6567 [Pseudocercospora musae]